MLRNRLLKRQAEDADDQITEKERVQAHELVRLKSRVVYEIIRQEGNSELKRPQSSIWWSGTAAGLAISISLAMEAMIRVHLPDAPWVPLIENFGYTAGFLLVILARLQLFTENTVTAVVPMLARPCHDTILGTARLWSTVFASNMVGTAIAAVLFVYSGILTPETRDAALVLSAHVGDWGFWETFIKAIPAGFLIAALVWMLPSSEGFEFWVIVFFTYLIALGEFAHVVVGSVEIFMLVADGQKGLFEAIGINLFPAFVGNVLGGAGLFTMLAWGQVHAEVEQRSKS